MSTFSALIQQKYDAALASKDLLFFEAETVETNARGTKFEITCVPSLGNKPKSDKDEKEKEKVNPFLSPNPKLLVDEKDQHLILLNKFCVVPHHILVVTKEFRKQTEPLFPTDLYETWVAMTTAYDKPAVAFYNCGPNSGASQEHKHVQIMPLRHDGPQPPLTEAFEEIKDRKAGQVYTIDKIPYIHVITPLDRVFIDSSTSKDELEDYLGQMFFGLLDSMFHQMRQHTQPTKTSYNFIMTDKFMMLVPRSKESATLEHEGATFEISVNSLGFTGLLLCKSDDEKKALEAHPDLFEFLVQLGIPWSEIKPEEPVEGGGLAQ
ncbi:HIT-like domain-containing protein [Phycomyces nitens]|nr:HIT-like domain-containing protein [Phycomyces nitens]